MTTPRVNIYDITKDHDVRIIIPLFQPLVIHPIVHQFFVERHYEDDRFNAFNKEQADELAGVLQAKLIMLRAQNDPSADLFGEHVQLWIDTTNDYLRQNNGYLAYYALTKPLEIEEAATRLNGFEAALRATAHLMNV